VSPHPAERLAALLRERTAYLPGPHRAEVDVERVGDRLRIAAVRVGRRTVTVAVGPDGDVSLHVDGVPLTEVDAGDDVEGLVDATLVPLVRALTTGAVAVAWQLDRRGRVSGAVVTFTGPPPRGLRAVHRYRVARTARR
jgi:hypothetical protein